MTRKELITSPEYSIVKIQNDLYNIIEKYMVDKSLNRRQFADKLGVSKSYITQILNGDFDHKISKLIDLSLSCNVKPFVFFVDMERYVNDDAEDFMYVLTKMNRHEYYKENETPSVISEPSQQSLQAKEADSEQPVNQWIDVKDITERKGRTAFILSDGTWCYDYEIKKVVIDRAVPSPPTETNK